MIKADRKKHNIANKGFRGMQKVLARFIPLLVGIGYHDPLS